MDIEKARFNMVEQQIRTWEVTDPDVLETLMLVKRERFVAPAQAHLAFADLELPVGQGQVMLSPKIEAKVLQALALRGTESVLEIGSGSGFMAALLAARAEWVRTVEIDARVAALAHANLERCGVFNVVVVEGDGSAGWAERAPYDVIVASGAVVQVPSVWFEQLKEGGRLFAFVGTAPVLQARLFTKDAQGQISAVTLFETLVPALRIAAGRKTFAL